MSMPLTILAINRFPATGCGRVPQVGTKAKSGPLFGVRGDVVGDARKEQEARP